MNLNDSGLVLGFILSIFKPIQPDLGASCVEGKGRPYPRKDENSFPFCASLSVDGQRDLSQGEMVLRVPG